ncbi:MULTISPECIES: hypothetical protein [Actinosynnema]|uniref:hypothetical protein n=1 Tax=Actinosynnema TaxID=40566 RepID=UPI0020A5EF05|nr:hypothetical protein [Actinosynnema pretiosum]
MIFVDIRDFTDWKNAHAVISGPVHDKIDLRDLGGTVLVMPRYEEKALLPIAYALSTAMTPAEDSLLAR